MYTHVITIFKFFSWDGISVVLRSDIAVYSFDYETNNIPYQMKNFISRQEKKCQHFNQHIK